jgi:MoaA/NifB/PqqE/SkfB family radical SAM enzyme
MLGKLTRWTRRLLTPPPRKISCLQLEVSTACQLECLYCPRTVLAAKWPSRMMAWELYEQRIAPYFAKFGLVFLQGWGEPLLNPRFWDMVALAKAGGHKVGFLTNGRLFDEQAAEQALDFPVDLVCFTLAGARAETHEYYRQGADFAALTDAIRRLAACKAERGLDRPVLGLSYTMMRRNLAELPAAVELAAALGANQFTVNNLDCMPSLALEEDAVFLAPRPEDEASLAAAARAAARAGLTFRAEPARMGGEILACEANPLHTTLFIGADGTVLPCHQMALLPAAVDHLYFRGQPCPYEPVVLGNVAAASLPAILASEEARRIFEIFELRAAGQVAMSRLPDAPAVCQFCYKLYGV